MITPAEKQRRYLLRHRKVALPNELIDEVTSRSNAASTVAALRAALEDWVARKRLADKQKASND